MLKSYVNLIAFAVIDDLKREGLTDTQIINVLNEAQKTMNDVNSNNTNHTFFSRLFSKNIFRRKARG